MPFDSRGSLELQPGTAPGTAPGSTEQNKRNFLLYFRGHSKNTKRKGVAWFYANFVTMNHEKVRVW